MRSSLNADLKVTSTFGHPSVLVGSVLVRLARLLVSSLSDLPAWLPESQRIWVQVSHHTSSCPVNDTVRGVLSVWQDVLHDVTCFQSVLLAPAFACEAYADASADEFSMGLGGYIKFTSGVKRFFQCTFRSRVLCLLFLVTQHESGLSGYPTLRHGSSWLSQLCCGLLSPCFPRPIQTYTSHSVARIPLRNLPRGRACLWHVVFAWCCVNSVTCSVASAFLHTLSTFLGFLATLLIV